MTFKRHLLHISSSLMLCMLLSFTATGYCAQLNDQDTIRLMVLPFKVNASQDLAYLSTQTATVLGGYLERDGARLVTWQGVEDVTAINVLGDTVQAMQIAKKNNLTHIIWGSLTKFGENFSIDAKLLSVIEDTPPLAFHVEGRSLVNLLSVLKNLSEQIGLKLFHRQIISAIHVQGNKRIEADAILRAIKSQVGSIYQPDNLSKDIKSIFEMGYFDDIRVEAESGPDGKLITFHVKEKPTIRRIKIKGSEYIKEDEIRENLTISTGSILNIFKIRNNIEQIESMYREKNYHKIHVDYKISPLENNQADLEFTIDEGPKLYVTDIVFEGNQAFSNDDLKDEMDTSEKGFFYWLTSSGDLDRSKLSQDVAKLNALYQNHGYIMARLGDPQIDILEDHIQITIKVNEGAQYKVGKVDITGDLIKPKDELIAKLSIISEPHYNQEKVRKDIIALTDMYGDEGYAYVDIRHRINEDTENLLVNITFQIEKKQQVFFENIIISGNTRTRDKVIRREMKINEQEMFSGSAIKRSIRNLIRLDYFEDIKVNQIRGSDENKLSLKIDVAEKATGTFSFGAGYSSEDNLFFSASISQRNFLGRGQTLELTGKIGSSSSRYNLSFTEPWLFDTKLSATIDAFNQENDYDEYDRYRYGAGLRLSYPVYDYTRAYWGYTYEFNDISDVQDNASRNIKELEGTNATSSTKVSLGYDSKDHPFNPSEGSKHSISFEYAGLGGDIGFNKYIAETGWYWPLYKDLVGFVHGKTGYVHENDTNKFLPDYEKFYLGGINSLRGFDFRDVSITNEDGDKVGGEYMVQFNVELIFPISKEAGLMGVVFYDTGNVYDQGIDLSDMRRTVGGGIRWFSPLAPIRLEYGQILDRREDEGSGRWEFTLGGAF